MQSTLFNALCENGKAQAANFPFCTIEPNVGVVAVPDERLAVLTRLNSSVATVPTTVEFVDIAGLVKGASKGEGLGNKCAATCRSTCPVPARQFVVSSCVNRADIRVEVRAYLILLQLHLTMAEPAAAQVSGQHP